MKFLKYFVFGFAYLITINSNASSIYSDSSFVHLRLGLGSGYSEAYTNSSYGRYVTNLVDWSTHRFVQSRFSSLLSLEGSITVLKAVNFDIEGFYLFNKSAHHNNKGRYFENSIGYRYGISINPLFFVAKRKHLITLGLGRYSSQQINSYMHGLSPTYSFPQMYVTYEKYNKGTSFYIRSKVWRRFSLMFQSFRNEKYSFHEGENIIINPHPGTMTPKSSVSWKFDYYYFSILYSLF